jgi:hypothetical protein
MSDRKTNYVVYSANRKQFRWLVGVMERFRLAVVIKVLKEHFLSLATALNIVQRLFVNITFIPGLLCFFIPHSL